MIELILSVDTDLEQRGPARQMKIINRSCSAFLCKIRGSLMHSLVCWPFRNIDSTLLHPISISPWILAPAWRIRYRHGVTCLCWIRHTVERPGNAEYNNGREGDSPLSSVTSYNILFASSRTLGTNIGISIAIAWSEHLKTIYKNPDYPHIVLRARPRRGFRHLHAAPQLGNNEVAVCCS